MKNLAGFCALLAVAPVYAAPADCTKIGDNQARLHCYDQEFRPPPPDIKSTGEQAQPTTPRREAVPGLSAWGASGKQWLKSNVTVRSDAQISGFGMTLGEDPAQIGYTRSRGDGATTAQFAALVKGPVFGSDRPMSTFFGIAIDRDTFNSDPTDVRQALVGAHWVAVPIQGQWGLQALFSARVQKDYLTDVRREVAVAQGLVVYKPWQHGVPGNPWSHITTPYFGVLRAHSSSVASEAAASRSTFYVGLTSTVYPFQAFSERLSFAAAGQLTRDVSIASNFARQTYRYAKASISYRLTPPSEGWIKPYFTVSREAGSDPITGKFHKGKTFIGISLQVTPTGE